MKSCTQKNVATLSANRNTVAAATGHGLEFPRPVPFHGKEFLREEQCPICSGSKRKLAEDCEYGRWR